MKKFWIIGIILVGFICASIFSTSFGKEENQQTPEQKSEYPFSLRKSNRRIFENPLWT